MALKTVTVLLNGQSYPLSLNNATGKYEAEITAPAKSSYSQADHYYAMSVTATDTAGNTTTVSTSTASLGEKLKLKVKETVKPVIKITAPTSGQTITNNKQNITFTVTDNDSGINAGTIKLTVDSKQYSGESIQKTATTGGYTCTWTPDEALSDGPHTISVSVSDNDGNEQTSAATSFKVDTTPPSLSVTAPADNFNTNQSSVTVTGTTNDTTSSPVTLQINGKDVTVQGDGSFSYAVTLTNGTNTITVTATDAAGKKSTVTRTVIYDTDAPVISSITITPNPVNTSTSFKIVVDVTD